jgi:hypothetical protein
MTKSTMRASAVLVHRRCSRADSHPQHGCNFTVQDMGTTVRAMKVDVHLSISFVHLSYLATASLRDHLALTISHPGLGAVRALEKKKTPFPNAANKTVASVVKQKRKTAQHFAGVAPRYRLASGLAIVVAKPFFHLSSGMYTGWSGGVLRGWCNGAGSTNLVLGLLRDLGGGIGGLGSLSTHVGTLGETTELYFVSVRCSSGNEGGNLLTVSTIMPVIW